MESRWRPARRGLQLVALGLFAFPGAGASPGESAGVIPAEREGTSAAVATDAAPAGETTKPAVLELPVPA